MQPPPFPLPPPCFPLVCILPRTLEVETKSLGEEGGEAGLRVRGENSGGKAMEMGMGMGGGWHMFSLS